MIIALIVLTFALIPAVSPRTYWYLTSGWKFKDLEASDSSLLIYRFTGIVLSLISIVVLLFSLQTSLEESMGPYNLKEKLEADQVISVYLEKEIDEHTYLKENEIKELTDLLKEVSYKKNKARSTYSYKEKIHIKLKGFPKLEILSFDGRYTMMTYDSSRSIYVFTSPELEVWLNKFIKD